MWQFSFEKFSVPNGMALDYFCADYNEYVAEQPDHKTTPKEKQKRKRMVIDIFSKEKSLQAHNRH